jgi:hypothetical protein
LHVDASKLDALKPVVEQAPVTDRVESSFSKAAPTLRAVDTETAAPPVLSTADLESYDLLQTAAKLRGIALPDPRKLTSAQWVAIREVQAVFDPQVKSLESRRVDRLQAIGEKRFAAGTLERSIQPTFSADGAVDNASAKSIAAAERPNVADQDIQIWSTPQGRFINRVNPGDDPEADRNREELGLTWSLYLDGVSRIIN